MIKEDYLVRMIREIITLIATALLNRRRIKPSQWIEYDTLTSQLLGLDTPKLAALAAEEVIDRFSETDTDRMGKIELAAMTLLKLSDEMTDRQLTDKYRLRHNGVQLLRYVSDNDRTFSLQRETLLQILSNQQS
ncbi:MAG: hypothetical protein Q4E55_05500 [Bacteroidales bacterium]|nr:hypothetical protein [Bacteroidales bacterium]